MYCIETSKHIIKLCYHTIANHSSFAAPNATAIFQRRPPCWGIEYKWSMKRIAIFNQFLALSRKWWKIWS